MNSEHVNTFSHVRSRIMRCAQNLESKANAFGITGNSYLSREFFNSAEELNKVARILDNLCGDLVAGCVREVDENGKNMLTACLAGAALGQKAKTS